MALTTCSVQMVAGLMSEAAWAYRLVEGGKTGGQLVADGKCQGCRQIAGLLRRPAELYGVTASDNMSHVNQQHSVLARAERKRSFRSDLF